jgi:hypothetical protein
VSENPYAPPASAVAEPLTDVEAGNEFFVTGATKMVLLNVATFGLYELFWFYMHWARIRRARHQECWPAARAVFAIFYTHKLVGEIDRRLRHDGKRHAWSPVATATTYVVVSIVSYIASNMPEGVSMAANFLPLVLMVPSTWCLVNIQRAANVACGRPDGGDNTGFTWANWTWLAVGGAVWLFVLSSAMLN